MLAIFVLIAGIGQIVLALGSTAIPRTLDWSGQLERLDPLLRRLFWVYAAYIFGTNLAFGLVSTALPNGLVDGSPLAAAVTSFIAVYWFSRVVIQFTLFRGLGPSGTYFVIAEISLVTLFVFFTGVFGWAAAVNVFGGGVS